MKISLFDYQRSKHLAMEPFYALLCAAFRQADTNNLEKLKKEFPDIYESFLVRYNAPCGVVEEWDGITAAQYMSR